MAEEKRSIEISYKANLKDLINKLKRLPDITSQEAKKMVSNLNQQIKQAEKAAAKSAKAQERGAKALRKSAAQSAEEFDKLHNKSRRASESLDQTADSAGDVDQGFSALSLGLRQVNPELAEAAENAADFSAVGEGLVKGLKGASPQILAAAAAVAVITFAFTAYQKSIEKANEATLAYRDAIKQLNAEQKALKANLSAAQDVYREQLISYLELTGQIDKYSASLMRTQEQIKGQFKGQLDQADQIIDRRKEDLLIIERLRAGETAISTENKERLKTLQLQLTDELHHLDLTKMRITEEAQLTLIQEELRKKLKEEEGERVKILNAQRKALNMAEQANELQQEYERELESEEKRQEAINALKDKSLLSQEDQNAALAEAQRLLALQQEMANKLLDLRGTELEKITARYDAEFKRMGELAVETRDFETFKALSQAFYEDRAKEYHELEMKRIRERRDAILDGSKMLVSSLDTFAQASMDFLNNTDRATEESMQKLHRLRQAAAVANIAIGLAETLARAATMGPVAGGLLAVAATTAAAAQTAAVVSEPPPTLHMGGLAPDERTRVLTGEAVLDRTTTRRLGDEGVRNLQNNNAGGGAEVIILQPFKHFDRYTRSARRRAGRMAGSGSY
jgi:hypothetical protein